MPPLVVAIELTNENCWKPSSDAATHTSQRSPTFSVTRGELCAPVRPAQSENRTVLDGGDTLKGSVKNEELGGKGGALPARGQLGAEKEIDVVGEVVDGDALAVEVDLDGMVGHARHVIDAPRQQRDGVGVQRLRGARREAVAEMRLGESAPGLRAHPTPES